MQYYGDARSLYESLQNRLRRVKEGPTFFQSSRMRDLFRRTLSPVKVLPGAVLWRRDDMYESLKIDYA